MANISFKIQTIFLIAVLTVINAPLFSQEETDFYDNPVDDSIYVINSFVFDIDGYTLPFMLVNKGNLIAGEEIRGLSNLEKYIIDKTQILYNERVLESVNIEYFIGQMREDGKYPVDLVIYVKDTWNIVAIPRPKYDSNSGWDITLKARDYNFLGTMSPLRLDLGYIYDEDGKSSFKLELDSNIPFRAFDLDWNIKFFNAFNYRPVTEQPFYYKNITGLSVELPVWSTVITVGFNESFLINDENSDIDKPLYGDFQDGFFMSSNPYVTWRIPTGVEVGGWGELEYTPGLNLIFNHELPAWPFDDIRKGPFLTFSHTLGFKRVDWIGNFQRGFDVYVGNSFEFDFYKYSYDKSPVNIDLKLSGTGHFIIADFFSISSRLLYRQWSYYDYGYDRAGDALRGIPDKNTDDYNVYADYMVSLNVDFTARILKFSPSVWFDKPKLRIFNFDLHLSPFIDTALYHDPVNDTEFSFKNILASGGFEIIVFPEFFRSLYLRFSFGWNLSDFSGWRTGELLEFFMGTDLHY